MHANTQLQQLVLTHFAGTPRLGIEQLAARLLPAWVPAVQRAFVVRQIRGACDALVAAGRLQVDRLALERTYLTPEGVRRREQRVRQWFMMPLFGFALTSGGCALLPGNTADREVPRRMAQPSGTVLPYHADGYRPPVYPSGITQVAGANGNAVYRFCYDDCPVPTPKTLRRDPPLGDMPAAQVQEPDGEGYAGSSPERSGEKRVVMGSIAAAPPPSPGSGTVNPARVAGSMNASMNKGVAGGIAEALRSLRGQATAEDAAGEVPAAPRLIAALPANREEPPVQEATVMRAEPEVDLVAPLPNPPVRPKKLRPRPAPVVEPKSAPPEPAAGNAAIDEPAAPVTPAVVAPPPEPPKPVKPRRKKYVDPTLDPNADDPPEVRAKVGRMMNELQHDTARQPASKAAPATAPAAGIPAQADMAHAETSVEIRPGLQDPLDFLAEWAKDWSARDASRYFARYGAAFVPQQAQTAEQFKTSRAYAMSIATRIDVKVETVSVKVVGDRALIGFWQQYESPRFKSRVFKTMELERAGEGWSIRRERVVDLSASGGVA